jgi:argininosuccinate synthase
MSGKVVLAYSGGLDTACILKVLIERGYEVVAYIADVGQTEDFDEIEARAKATGAAKTYVEDLKSDFVTEFIFPAIAGNAVYENRYLLGTALARPLIARRQVEIALREGATHVAHGATGKGNDQVRFEFAYAALAPRLKVLSLWKDRDFLNRFRGRSDLIRYAREHAIPVEATAEKPFVRSRAARGSGVHAGGRHVPADALAAGGAGRAGHARHPLQGLDAGARREHR